MLVITFEDENFNKLTFEVEDYDQATGLINTLFAYSANKLKATITEKEENEKESEE